MAHNIINDYSRQNTVAFWLTIAIGLGLLVCIIFLLINFTISLF